MVSPEQRELLRTPDATVHHARAPSDRPSALSDRTNSALPVHAAIAHIHHGGSAEPRRIPIAVRILVRSQSCSRRVVSAPEDEDR